MGVITKPHLFIFGKFVSFRAIKARYMVFGEKRTVAVGNLQRLTFKNEFKGILGSHFVCAIFDGAPIAI